MRILAKIWTGHPISLDKVIPYLVHLISSDPHSVRHTDRTIVDTQALASQRPFQKCQGGGIVADMATRLLMSEREGDFLRQSKHAANPSRNHKNAGSGTQPRKSSFQTAVVLSSISHYSCIEYPKCRQPYSTPLTRWVVQFGRSHLQHALAVPCDAICDGGGESNSGWRRG